MDDSKIIFKLHDGSGYYVWNGENLSGTVVHRTKNPLDANDYSLSRRQDALGMLIGVNEADGEFVRVTFEPAFTDAIVDDEGFFE